MTLDEWRPEVHASDPAAEGLLMRPAIRRSWRRSSLNGIDRGHGSLIQAGPDVDLDTELQTAAAPIVAKLENALGFPALIVLSDGEGRLIRCGGSESKIRRRFEDLGACPGASAGEQLVGTNAVGTAIEEGHPIVVVGSEHYQENFEQITCAAALVRSPLTRRTLGSIALAALDVGAREDMLPLAVSASRAIERRLLEHASAADRLVLEALKIRGGGAHRSVLGISRDVVISNEPGMRLLPRLDQALLLERARKTVETGQERKFEVVLGADTEPVPVNCIPVRDADVTVGALIDFGCIEIGSGRSRLATSRRDKKRPALSAGESAPDPIIGVSREAKYLMGRLAVAARSTGAVLVSGEPGTGKATIANTILLDRFPDREPVVVCCSDPNAVQDLAIRADADVPILLAHVELLNANLAYRLRDTLRRSPELRRCWVATTNITKNAEAAGALIDVPLIDELGGPTLEVPCLRYRRDDIAPLVEHFTRQAGKGLRQFSTEAMQLMLRYPWPGNIRELRSVVKGAIESTSGDIELEDLPANLRRLATRRPLTPLEQAEADAILAAMSACANNKVKAAEMLQISRSRLYRKARAYGLVGAVLG